MQRTGVPGEGAQHTWFLGRDTIPWSEEGGAIKDGARGKAARGNGSRDQNGASRSSGCLSFLVIMRGSDEFISFLLCGTGHITISTLLVEMQWNKFDVTSLKLNN